MCIELNSYPVEAFPVKSGILAATTKKHDRHLIVTVMLIFKAARFGRDAIR